MYRFTTLIAAAACVFGQIDLTSYEVIEDQTTVEILTPILSGQKRSKIQLENGLKALIISDPQASKAAAALCVRAGAWNDPHDLPGLAHFLEHMLFMGTGKYPVEDDFMKFISDHAGERNAYTSSDRTVYIFEVDPTAMNGALDRFSRFFIDPLFSKSSVGRELHAIDQEHAKNIENDPRRSFMILKEVCKKSHPMSLFSTGNLETLQSVPIERLRAWYEEHYTPDAMTLVVVSPQPLAETVTLVESLFSEIPTRTPRAQSKMDELMLKEHALGSEILIDAKQHSQILSVLWEVPVASTDISHIRAFDLIGYALTRKTPKSLYEYLKSQGWLEDLGANLHHFAPQHAVFEVEFNLTPKGIEQREQVLVALYDALGQLSKKVPPHLMSELSMQTKLSYQYQETTDPFEYVSGLAHASDREDFATYPEQISLFSPISTTLVTEELHYLTPQRAVTRVVSDSFSKEELKHQERWTGTNYTVKKFSSEFLKTLSTVKQNSHVDLSAVNPFILTQVPDPVARDTQWKSIEPKLILDKKEAILYYAQDRYFGLPKMNLTLGIRSTALDGTCKSIVATDLLLHSFMRENANMIDAANYAGITAEFAQDKLAIQCSFEGYVEKTPLLIKELLTNLKNFWVDKEHFDHFKEQLMLTYLKEQKSSPVKIAFDLARNVLLSDSPMANEKLLTLENLTHEEFLLFCNKVFKKHIFEGTLYGALNESNAQALSKDLIAILNPKPLESSELQHRSFLVLPEGRGPYLIQSESPLQGHSVLLAIEAGPYTINRRCFHQILSKCLMTEFFDTLRTKQQTGYIVTSFDRVLEHHLVQYFAVQSNSHRPGELLARFELFLEDFVRGIDERFPLERFQALRSTLMQELMTPPTSFSIASQSLYKLAFEEKGDFLLIEKKIEALKQLRYEDLAFHASEMLSRKNSRRIAVAVEGRIPKENEFRYRKVQRDELRQMGMLVFDE